MAEQGKAAREESFQLAALRASGRHGYRRFTVQDILDLTGLSRPRFYRSFGNKEECYVGAYQAGIEALAEELLGAGATAPDWITGFRGSLRQLACFIQRDPEFSRGLLAEVYVARGAAWAKRQEVFERLSRAVDTARRETTSPARQSPPPITADFILHAAESAVLEGFFRDEIDGFEAAIPSLTRFAAMAYFGEPAR